MNSKQRFVIVLALLGIIALGFYPPWRSVLYGADAQRFKEAFAGHHFIFAPPARFDNNGYKIDLIRLVVYAFFITLASIGMLWVFNRKQN